MSTATAPAPDIAPAPAAAPANRLSFGRLVRSETIKLASIRSPWWTIIVIAIISVGMSVAMAFAMMSFASGEPAGAAEASRSAVAVILMPTMFTILLATVLGSIQVTGEYSTGMIRSTLTAAPGRVGSLLAKALVVAAFVFLASLAIYVISAIATAPVLAPGGIVLDLTDPSVSLLPMLAGAFTMASIAVLGLGAGYALRSGPGAIVLAVGIVLVLPMVTGFFPNNESWQWVHEAARYLPSNAGQSLMYPGMGLDTLPAVLALLGWAAAALLIGGAVLRRRDA